MPVGLREVQSLQILWWENVCRSKGGPKLTDLMVGKCL